MPKGANGNIRFTYQFERGGATLQIHRNPKKNQPNVGIVYGYNALYGKDLKDVHSNTINFLKTIGFILEKESLQRVDINVTLAIPFDFVQTSYQENRVVSRVRDWNLWYNKSFGGFTLETLSGGAHLQACLYDKFRELTVKRDEQKYDDLRDLIEPFETQPALSRVEFRFKREALKVYGLETVDDFTSRIADVVEYVTSKWFRVLDRPKVRGKEIRQELSQEWRWVQYAFWATFCVQKKRTEPLKRDTTKKIDKRMIFAQACGCLSSAFAYDMNEDRPTLSFEEFAKRLDEAIYARLFDLYKDYLSKRCFFNVTKRGAPSDVATQFAARAMTRPSPPREEAIPF